MCQLSCNVRAKFSIPRLVFPVILGYIHFIAERGEVFVFKWSHPRPLHVRDREKVRTQSSRLVALKHWLLSPVSDLNSHMQAATDTTQALHPAVTHPKYLRGWCMKEKDHLGKSKATFHHHQGKKISPLIKISALLDSGIEFNKVHLLVWKRRETRAVLYNHDLGHPTKFAIQILQQSYRVGTGSCPTEAETESQNHL